MPLKLIHYIKQCEEGMGSYKFLYTISVHITVTLFASLFSGKTTGGHRYVFVLSISGFKLQIDFDK